MKLLRSVAGWVRITLTCAAIAIAVFVALDDVSSYSRCKGKAFGTADFYLMGNPSPAKVLDCQELHWGGSLGWLTAVGLYVRGRGPGRRDRAAWLPVP